jgi:hypothetical protein
LTSVRCRERFAGIGEAEKRLVILARAKAGDGVIDGARLIAGGSEGGDDLEGGGHERILRVPAA